MKKNKLIVVIGIILLLIYMNQPQQKETKKMAGETVSWSAPTTITPSGTLTITATPNSMTAITGWTAEGITIPSGWTLQSAVFSGGSGMGGQGCAVESGVLNCAAAGSTPADVPTTLTIKFTAPASGSTSFSGSYTTAATDKTTNSGTLSSLSVSVQAATYSCTGTIFSYSTLCPNDDAGLTSNTARTLVASCGIPKCEYTCNNSGYSIVGGVCTPNPVGTITVSWSGSSSVVTSGTLQLIAVPSTMTNIKAWTAEGITIPSGWTLQSAVFSGGSGMGGQGCAVESGVLNCAASGNAPTDVPTTLTIKFTAPSTTQSGIQFSGTYTTSDSSGALKSGSLNSLTVNVGSSTCTYSDWSPTTCPVSCTQTRTVLTGTSCSGLLSQPCTGGSCNPTQTCSQLGGTTCSTGQTCEGGSFVTASDTTKCCSGGTCTTPEKTCEQINSCEFFQKCNSAKDGCTLAGWVYMIIAFMAFMMFTNMMK